MKRNQHTAPITPEQTAAAIELRKQGITLQAIKARLNLDCCLATVWNRCADAGVYRMTVKDRTYQAEAEVLALYKGGMTGTAVAAKLGLCEHTVYDILRRRGVLRQNSNGKVTA